MSEKDLKIIKTKIDLSGNKSTNKKSEIDIDEILTKLLISRK